MLDDIRAQPHQIGDALWRADAAGIPLHTGGGGLVVCGLGGSAAGADVAAAALADRLSAPMVIARGYRPPAWVSPDTLVLCSSYSGETEETLSCYEAAGAAGAPRVAVTTGGRLAQAARADGVPVIGVPAGMAPRVAIVYMAVAAFACAERAGVAPSSAAELEAAVPVLERILAAAPGAEVAERLVGAVPVTYGAGVGAAAARRLKNQLNENAKRIAFAGELPEACHNDIEGWTEAAGRFAAVFLTAPGADARIDARIDAFADMLTAAGAPVARIEADGDGPIAHALSLVLLGDLVSLALAEREGVDPGPIPAITELKRRLQP